MSFLLPLLCAALGGLAGVLAGRHWRARSEDPAVSADAPRLAAQKEELAATRAESDAIRQRAERQRDELVRAREHIEHLEHQAAAYLRQYAQAKDLLKKEILQNGSLRTELAAGNAEVQALRARIQELTMNRGGDPAQAQRKNA